MRKEKTKKKITGLGDERGIQQTERRSSTSRNMKLLEVWTCQRAENLKRKSSKIPKNNYAATMVSAARRQIMGGGGGAPINKSRRRRRPQIVGGGGAARPAHGSKQNTRQRNPYSFNGSEVPDMGRNGGPYFCDLLHRRITGSMSWFQRRQSAVKLWRCSRAFLHPICFSHWPSRLWALSTSRLWNF